MTASELQGKVAIISGATSGIGLACALRLAELGANVVGFGIGALPETDANITFVAADITDEAVVHGVVADTAATAGGIDIVVHAAGIQRYGTAVDTSAQLWEEVFAVNARGCLFLAKHAIPHMRSRGGGTIVAVSSVQAMMNQRTVAAYAASKAALNGLIRAIAIDEAANGIRANSVCPASVDTPMLRAAARDFSDGTDEQIEDLVRRWGRVHPIGRVAETTEVAEVVAFLSSPRSGFITGVSLPVDGGLLIGAPVQLP